MFFYGKKNIFETLTNCLKIIRKYVCKNIGYKYI
jgi:hypothetical protein